MHQMNVNDRSIEIRKIATIAQLLERNYGVKPFTGNGDDILHDLDVMRKHGDLPGVVFELLDAHTRIVGAVEVTMGASAPAGGPNHTGGFELPFFSRSKVHSCRFLVRARHHEERYRHLLRCNWSAAAKLTEAESIGFESEHVHRTTAGRQAGSIKVAKENLVELIVTQAGARGYAFGDCPTLGLSGVFLHPKHAAQGLAFRVGQRLRAQVVSVPRGLQARCIQPA